MQYFILKEACATKETGPVYPQIQKWKPGYDDGKPDSFYSYWKASKGGEFPEFEPNMDSLIMHTRAKPTDMVSSGVSLGFVISEKLKSIFQDFQLPPHRYFPAKIIHKKVPLDGYYFMHIISNYIDFVDYKKTTFFTCGFNNIDPMPIPITSKEDFIKKAEELQDDSFIKKLPYRSIHSNHICFNGDFDRNLDLFEIGRFNINFYISEKLKNALTENGITGCNIKPTEDLII